MTQYAVPESLITNVALPTAAKGCYLCLLVEARVQGKSRFPISGKEMKRKYNIQSAKLWNHLHDLAIQEVVSYKFIGDVTTNEYEVTLRIPTLPPIEESEMKSN